jgi:copper chaperone CopZ
MKCNNCVEKIEGSLNERPNIRRAKVNLKEKFATVIHTTNPEEVLEAINELGFETSVIKNKQLAIEAK